MSTDQIKPGVDSASQDTTPVSVANAPAPINQPAAAPALESAAQPMSKEDLLRDMLKNGVHFGHQTRRWNPKMQSYIFTERGGVHIIDLLQTIDCLNQAKKVAGDIVAKGGIVLFVCTKRQGQKAVAEIATDSHMPYVKQRWLGGLFTNFKELKKRIDYLNNLRGQRDRGEFETLIKKERAVMLRNLDRLENLFGGISTMTKLPDLIFVIDPKRESIVVKEAHAVGIPVMSTLDTNCDPDQVDYPIPANDDAIRSIRFILEQIGSTIKPIRLRYEAEHNIQLAQPQSAQSEIEPDAVPQVVTTVQSAEQLSDKSDRDLSLKLELEEEEDSAEVAQPRLARKAKSETPAAKKRKGGKPTPVEPTGTDTATTAISAESLPDLSPTILKKLAAGFATLPDLLRASKEDLIALPGIGAAKAQQILDVIKSIK